VAITRGEFVAACQICTQNTTSRQRPTGLLHPLPVPRLPRSHVSLNYVTSLPLSEGNRHSHHCWFSKMVSLLGSIPVQWPAGVLQPGDGDRALLYGLPERHLLEPTAQLGGVCPRLSCLCHRSRPLLVCLRVLECCYVGRLQECS